MVYDAIPRFSRAIFLLSLAALFLSLIFMGVYFSGSSEPFYRSVAPRLVFGGGQDVRVKTIFDDDFVAAAPHQAVRADTEIRTGEGSFAQLELDGNLVRLDQNTTVRFSENRFTEQPFLADPAAPRLSFELLSGSVWLSVHEPVRVRGGRHAVTFMYSVGSFTYAPPMNRVMVMAGGADLELYGESGEILRRYLVPFRHQVTFADAQVTPAYALLRPSKLRKELKLGAVSDEVLNDEWVRNNYRRDTLFASENTASGSIFSYPIRDAYHAFRYRFSWLPEARRHLRLIRIREGFDFIAGVLHPRDDLPAAQALLKKLDALAADLQGDFSLYSLSSRRFHTLPYAAPGSPAFLLKNYLAKNLLTREGPVLLRTHLMDMEGDLAVGKTKDFTDRTGRWLDAWPRELTTGHSDEFIDQSRLYFSLVLAYAPEQSDDFLIDGLNLLSDFRLQRFPDDAEVLFSVIRERLDLASRLIADQRFNAAQLFLKTAYAFLETHADALDASAVHLFTQQADLLQERLAFAESQLHGAAAAGPLDETAFREYLRGRARDTHLSASLQSFLESEPETAADGLSSLVSADEVAERFSQARIRLSEDDIRPLSDNSFGFAVRNARLQDRGADGASFTFDAAYDFISNTVHDLSVNGEPFKGSFSPDALVRVLTQQASAGADSSATETVSLDSGFFMEGDDESLRAELRARDLAIQLAMEALRSAEVQLAGPGAVQILNEATLNEFHVAEAFLKADSAGDAMIAVTFDLNLSSRQVSRLRLLDRAAELPSVLPLSDLASGVRGAFAGALLQGDVVEKAYETLRAKGLRPENGSLHYAEGSRVRFGGFSVADIPVEASGIYDTETGLFVRAEHPLLSLADIAAADYLNQLLPLLAADLLKQAGISVDASLVRVSESLKTITVAGFPLGDRLLDFEIDWAARRLKNITAQGKDAVFPSMTFAEFTAMVQSSAATSQPPAAAD